LFTAGNHVASNQGEHDPESPEGHHVLAHELVHVRQQTDGVVSMLPPEPFRTVGLGTFIYARQCNHYDLYPTFDKTETGSGGVFG